MLVRMTSWLGIFRASALIALLVLSLGACRRISAGVAVPIVSRALPPGNATGLQAGLVINTGETRLEVNVFQRARCLSGPGCLLELAATNQFMVRQSPLLQFFMGASVPEVVRMGGKLTVQPIVLPPGDYTALYCVSYASEFGCRDGWGLGVAHFNYHPGHFVRYQEYPYDPYLYTKVITLPWRLDIGVSNDRPLQDFVGFWILFDLTCVREPWLCKGEGR